MTAHKHAENMTLYAQDAAETTMPWLWWEMKSDGCKDFVPLQSNPHFDVCTEYRRKPRTIRIGDRDVPAPMTTAPEIGTKYWLVLPHCLDKITPMFWNGNTADAGYLKHGLCHTAKEAAIAHAEALILVSRGNTMTDKKMQEPTFWVVRHKDQKLVDVFYEKEKADDWALQFHKGWAWVEPVYTAAQPAPVPLTPGQRKNLWFSATIELPSQENCYYRRLLDAEAYHGITAAPERKLT